MKLTLRRNNYLKINVSQIWIIPKELNLNNCG